MFTSDCQSFSIAPTKRGSILDPVLLSPVKSKNMSYNSLSSSSRLCEVITFSNSFFLSSSSIFAVSWMLSFSTTLSSLWILSECPYLSFSLGCFDLFPGRFSDKDLFPDEFSDLFRFPGLFSDGNLELLTASDPQLLCNLFILLFTFALKSSNVGFKTICYLFFCKSVKRNEYSPWEKLY